MLFGVPFYIVDRRRNMQKIRIKGAIIPISSIPEYKKQGREYTSLEDIYIPSSNEPLEVEINSGGGDVYTANEIYAKLRDYKGVVTVKITGIAASAASVIAMAGDIIEMSPIAMMMIHNVSALTYGNIRQLKQQIRTMDVANDALANAYHERTGLSKEKIKEMMDVETWMSCDTAIYLGFADRKMFVKNITSDKVRQIAASIPSAGVYEYMEKTVKPLLGLNKKLEATKKNENVDLGDYLPMFKAKKG